MDILVSVNCITYNHERYIGSTIEGFLSQKTNFAFEILIGEDCSKDGTRAIIESYMNKFPGKIRLITSSSNVGAKKNSERLVEASNGKYIALCEGDDLWTNPHKLQKQIDYLENHPDCVLCFHSAEIVNGMGKPLNQYIRPYKKTRNSPVRDMIAGGGGFCPTASLVFRREIIDPLPALLKEAHVGDYALQMWAASKGSIHYIDEMMSAYRVGIADSWSTKLNSGSNMIEKNIEVKKLDIQLLNHFNQETSFRYSDEIEGEVLKKEFEILLLQKNFKVMRTNKYKKVVKELSKIDKTKLYTRMYFPGIYQKVVEMKYSLNTGRK
ncbi:glycosyltransferase [Cytobacillus praedii]|uniref:glycosyltransferase n=1 Tax=Cytobacillus praedii TaxID=1742358 RepID=UPI002E226B5F|nr:glycosyltransferase [Cytobacillus praedii]